MESGFKRMRYTLRYHVPRSQCFEGSAGQQSGHVHLHIAAVVGDFEPRKFDAVFGRKGFIVRYPGESLCGRQGWYERDPEDWELCCPKCQQMAYRYGIDWPTREAALTATEGPHDD